MGELGGRMAHRRRERRGGMVRERKRMEQVLRRLPILIEEVREVRSGSFGERFE